VHEQRERSEHQSFNQWTPAAGFPPMVVKYGRLWAKKPVSSRKCFKDRRVYDDEVDNAWYSDINA